MIKVDGRELARPAHHLLAVKQRGPNRYLGNQTMPESRTNVSDAVKGGPAASQAVDSAVLEAQPVIPIYNNDGCLIRFANETEARAILKANQGQLVRDKHGILRRIYLKSTPEAYSGPGAERLGPGSINSQASRTVRRESVGNIYSVFAPIMSDLRLKKRISNEELAKDSVFVMSQNLIPKEVSD